MDYCLPPLFPEIQPKKQKLKHTTEKYSLTEVRPGSWFPCNSNKIPDRNKEARIYFDTRSWRGQFMDVGFHVFENKHPGGRSIRQREFLPHRR